MTEFPEKGLLQKLLPWLLECRQNNRPPFVSVAEIKKLLQLTDDAYGQLFHWLFQMGIWKPLGGDRLELTNFLEEFNSRFPVTGPMIDFHLLHRFSQERQQRQVFRLVLPIIINARQAGDLPVVTVKTLLSFGDKTSEGRLVEAVALPWFDIMRLIHDDPTSIYAISPQHWEEIIAGAYRAAGFDEVILTPRSGDKGRDVIATKTGVGSIRFIDQMKAYKPGHLVTAEEVRAIVGVLHMEQNVSKAVITTTSDFAPRVRDDTLINPLMPTRLELRPRDVLLPWLGDVAGKAQGQ